MDKRKVIAAYRRGYITMTECAQILGMETDLAAGLLDERPESGVHARLLARARQPAGR